LRVFGVVAVVVVVVVVVMVVVVVVVVVGTASGTAAAGIGEGGDRRRFGLPRKTTLKLKGGNSVEVAVVTGALRRVVVRAPRRALVWVLAIVKEV
jgi:hypothetical protein